MHVSLSRSPCPPQRRSCCWARFWPERCCRRRRPAAADENRGEPPQRGYTWEFPRDLGIHPDYKTEWWYVTGHLFPVGTEPAEAMAFQLTFFRVGLVPPGVDRDRIRTGRPATWSWPTPRWPGRRQRPMTSPR